MYTLDYLTDTSVLILYSSDPISPCAHEEDLPMSLKSI